MWRVADDRRDDHRGDERRDADRPTAALRGLKYLRPLMRHLRKLRSAAAAAHGNRVLFGDDLLVAYLVAFFNPACRSLRTIEDLSQTPALRPHLRVDRVCRSTASDAAAVFDPRLLDPLVGRLRARLGDLRQRDPTLGRFIQPDPIGLAGGLNLYEYSDGDPLRGCEVLGLTGT